MADFFTYQTVAGSSEAEYKDRGSRFIAYCDPVEHLEDIKARIKALKELHPKAVHHCFAWRLGTDGTQFRASDDGEPSGSAGKPILGQLDSAGVTNTLIVVVRYFGGTLLGVPGLIQAYKTAAHEALQANTILTKKVERTFRLSFDYTLMNEVMRVVKQMGCRIIKQDMNLFCTMEIGIALTDQSTTLKKLEDLRGIEVSSLSGL